MASEFHGSFLLNLVDAIKPGEKRLLSYAADLGLLVDAKEKEDKQQATWVAIKHGVMTHVSEERQERTYTIHNRDTAPRTVVIEHPIREGWKLADGTEPAESSSTCYRGHGALPDHGDRAPHGWCFWQESGYQKTCGIGAP